MTRNAFASLFHPHIHAAISSLLVWCVCVLSIKLTSFREGTEFQVCSCEDFCPVPFVFGSSVIFIKAGYSCT